MKKNLPYFLIGFVVLAMFVLILSQQWGSGMKQKKRLNERISFRIRDKIPYGMYAAYTTLKSFFPQASVSAGRDQPGYWDSLSEYSDNQALMIVTPQFKADKYEMKNLISFIEAGNNVIISTMSMSYDASKMMKCNINSSVSQLYYYFENDHLDTLNISLARPPFEGDTDYSYPGKQFDSYFSKIDSSVTTVLGYDRLNRPDFIRLRAGEGNLYIHLAPLAFSNYFLMHKNNLGYYEKILSLIPAGTDKIVWDEYYLFNKQGRQEKTSWLSVFFRYPALKWALITAIATLIIFLLMEMRRKQRPIPVITKPRNDSLDFVKTVGRLYHDKGDHKNLCKKMAAYFLEHVRNQYKLPTSLLNDEFITNLTFKTGADEAEIRAIVSFINNIGQQAVISDDQLAKFHKQLEKFYRYA